MLEVAVFSRNVLIGTSQLFASDPPMGVASGLLVATPAYAALRPEIDAILATKNPDWTDLALTIVTKNGTPVHGVGGIWIEGFGEDEDFLPEVIIAGIDCASGLYEAWFGSDAAYLDYYAR